MSQGLCVCTLHMPVTLQMHKAFSASALKINDMENVAATTSLLSRGIYRELQVKGLLSSSDSAYSWHRHRVFIEAPPPPLPTSLPLSKERRDKPLMRAPLISRRRLCFSSFLSPIILPLLPAGELSRVLRPRSLIAPDHVSGLFHPHARCFSKAARAPGGHRRHPKSSLNQVAATSSPLKPIQLIRVGFFSKSQRSH